MTDFSAVADYGARHLGWREQPEPTTDHAERSVQLLASAAKLTDDNTELPLILSEAQVHATLAAAENQHTANLIAFLTLLETRGVMTTAYKDIDERVRERLDLA
jgi:hypothetical protein